MADTCEHCNELSGFMQGRMFVHEVTTTFPRRAMLHVLLPLLVQSEYGQADRLTLSSLIHFQTMNSCFSVNLDKNT